MSKAREIAEERLAKGEISKAEFDEIINALSNKTDTPSPTPTETVSADQGTVEGAADTKEIDDLRTLLHNGGGALATIGTALLATVFFRMMGDDYAFMNTGSIMSVWNDGSGGFGPWLMAMAAIWVASFFAVGALSMIIKSSVIGAVNKTTHPQNTLAELARLDAKRDDSFREQHIIHTMPGETGNVTENQYQTKIRNIGAFVGALLIFAALSSFFGSG